ncbi:MAG: hypothetical protein KJO69_10180 [Gammaproteobacteria bacterium]|nr:hypothetical protein [Gammaproteobacteria bacterium]
MDIVAGFKTAEAVVLTSDFTVTINNGNAHGIWVGATGDIVLVTPNGETVTYQNVPVGQWSFPCTEVKSTANGTTASDLVVGAW